MRKWKFGESWNDLILIIVIVEEGEFVIVIIQRAPIYKGITGAALHDDAGNHRDQQDAQDQDAQAREAFEKEMVQVENEVHGRLFRQDGVLHGAL